MSLVISTAWNAFRYSDAEKMIDELKELGFSEVELSFNLTSGMVDSVEKLVRRGSIAVSSVHNFCPVPEGYKREEALPDFFSMASTDHAERRRSVQFAKGSIDTAVRLHARAVVLHCGRVEMGGDLCREMARVFDHEGASARFHSLKDTLVSRRAALCAPYLESALRSLDELNRYAAERGICLGVETRYYYGEIPTCAEVRRILDTFRGGSIRYWHDVGHAQVAENFGLARQEDFLAAYKDDLLGMHLHDVVGSSDHKSPGSGAVDFGRLVPFITPETIKVIETHHPAPGIELIRGREFLKTVFNGKA